MNATENPESGAVHGACLSIGSNIEPEKNIPLAAQMLRAGNDVVALSSCWETYAVGSNGPNFINMAAYLKTPLGMVVLKAQVIDPIETALGRVRT